MDSFIAADATKHTESVITHQYRLNVNDDDDDGVDYNRVLQLNVVVVTELCSLFVKDMIARRRGRIAILSSISAMWPSTYYYHLFSFPR
jgi:NADP-dependent 3-hydroxy acid dehydrogenase YdfG